MLSIVITNRSGESVRSPYARRAEMFLGRSGLGTKFAVFMRVVVAHLVPDLYIATVATVVRVPIFAHFSLSLSPVLLDFMTVVK